MATDKQAAYINQLKTNMANWLRGTRNSSPIVFSAKAMREIRETARTNDVEHNWPVLREALIGYMNALPIPTDTNEASRMIDQLKGRGPYSNLWDGFWANHHGCEFATVTPFEPEER
jgi:hypothetical protein